MSAEQRLVFHQEHSKPVMEKLHVWLKTQLDERLATLAKRPRFQGRPRYFEKVSFCQWSSKYQIACPNPEFGAVQENLLLPLQTSDDRAHYSWRPPLDDFRYVAR